MDLKRLLAYLVRIRKEKEAPERLLKKLKEYEDKIQDAIRNALVASGAKSTHIEGVGKATITNRSHVEVQDVDKMRRFIIARIDEARANGCSELDALTVFGQTHKKTAVEELLAAGFLPEDMGLAIVEKSHLLITTTKG